MITKRLKFCIFQFLAFFPLSIIINILALVPIFVLLGFLELGEGAVNERSLFVLIATFLVCWGVGFFANKLRMNIRGRWTTWSEEMEVEERLLLVDRWGDEKELASRRYTETRYHDTWYAVIATLLSFVAAPLGFVALIMSILALFYPTIFSTPCKIEEERFSRGNIILHTLFDFVVLKPNVRSSQKNPSPLGLLGILEILVIAAIGAAIALLAGKLLVDNGFEIRPDLGIPLVLFSQLFVLFWALISVLVTLIDTISLTLDFSLQHIGKIAVRAVILAIIISIPMLGITLSWGQFGALSMTWEELKELIEIYLLLFS